MEEGRKDESLELLVCFRGKQLKHASENVPLAPSVVKRGLSSRAPLLMAMVSQVLYWKGQPSSRVPGKRQQEGMELIELSVI